MQHNGTIIEDEYAEAFGMWAARVIVTADDRYWVDIAATEACGYGTSVIGCDAEVGLEKPLEPEQTPDGRPGVAILMFAFNADALARAITNRTGQCLMTCPTTAVYDGLPAVGDTDSSARLDLGKYLSYFGDGYQKRKTVNGRGYWRIPVTEGEFLVEESIGAMKAIGGGNFLICARDQTAALAAARRAVTAIQPLADVITPFPGGVVRCASKVGSHRYKTLTASTNDAYCPTLRKKTDTKLRDGVNCVYEIVIDGFTEPPIATAMQAGIAAACGKGVIAISAGNYGGRLGSIHFRLHVLSAM